ncbi:MAG TPA: class I SAM-dependent methyltransferase [Planctomycetaceae bacterium]|nr:class I SAM-dependent methyltransferase [Planctomycetaceae bacterium]
MIRTVHRDREAIGYHYDVSDDFYELFLDKRMLYSCAYYRTPDASLEQAQADKLDIVCRKLHLQPGEKMLDVGCGWGGLTIWAAQNYGVSVQAITLSRNQAEYAQRAFAREGLSDRCSVKLIHWKEFQADDQFDKIAAVGIIEHVGIPLYAEFFSKIYSFLKPGGMFLNHGITHKHSWKTTGHTRFINKYVFPNGELESITRMLQCMSDCNWEVLDVEQLRYHYALTCRMWVDGLMRNEARAIELAGEKIYRIWLAYLAGSAISFETGDLGLYQTVVRKPHTTYTPLPPTTRESIYDYSTAR